MNLNTEKTGEGVSSETVYAVLGASLLSSQKVILLALEAARRPLSLREIMEVLNHPWPVNRRIVMRQIEPLVYRGNVTLDRGVSPHLYSLQRIA